ncbi:MAG: AAA family ATPase [Pseudomonadota bacterium]
MTPDMPRSMPSASGHVMAPDRFVSLADIIPILWQRRGIVMVVAVVVMMIGGAGIARFDPAWRAVAEIGFSHPVPALTGGQGNGFGLPAAYSNGDLETEAAILRSTSVLSAARAVIVGQGVEISPAEDIRPGDDPEVLDIAALRGKITVEQAGHARVLEIAVRDHDPVRATLIADAIVETYVWQRERDQRRVLSNRLMDIVAQREQAETALQQADANIAAWQAGNGFLEPDDSDMARTRLRDLTPEYEAARIEFEQVRDRVLAWQKAHQGGNADTILALPEIAGDETLRSMTARHSQLRGILSDLRQRYGDRHPMVIARQAESDALDTDILQAATRIGNQMTRDLAQADIRQSQLAARMAQWQDALQLRHVARLTLNDLIRKADLVRQNLAILGETERNVRAELAALQPDAEILRMAEIPGQPEFPARRDLALAVVMLALFAAMTVALLRHYSDQAVRSGDDLTQFGAVPLFAEIPLAGHDGEAEERDAVAHLRTMLQIGGIGVNRKIVCLTSAVSGEGKSRLARNLARSFAAAGRKTLLLDADLRRPSHAALPGAMSADLCAVLIGECDLADAIVRSGGGLADFIGARAALPGDMASLLIAGKMPGILTQLREIYDVIVVDAPPVLPVSDAIWLMKTADTGLLLVRAGHSKAGDISRAIARLVAGVGPMDGMVLIGVPSRGAYGGAVDHATSWDAAAQ